MSWYKSVLKPKIGTKTVTATTSTATYHATDDSYDGYSDVTVNPQSHTAYEPSSGYIQLSAGEQREINLGLNHDIRYVKVQAPSGGNIQLDMQVTVTPDVQYSSNYTAYSSPITPDSGYDGIGQVQVRVPMIRDNNALTASVLYTPDTLYDGDTSRSNSKQCVRLLPKKNGYVGTNSYLYMEPNSLLGDASAGDVRSGKYFSSSNGIKVQGTWDAVTPTSITPSDTSSVYMASGSSYKPSVSGYAIRSQPYSYSSVTPSYNGAYLGSGWNRLSSSGYAYNERFSADVLWTNYNLSNSFSAQTVTLSYSISNYSYIRFDYYINYGSSSSYSTVVYPREIVQSTAYNTNKPLIALNGATSTSVIRTRNVEYVSSTSLKFHQTRSQNNANSTTNNYMIPYRIIGFTAPYVEVEEEIIIG